MFKGTEKITAQYVARNWVVAPPVAQLASRAVARDQRE